MRERLPIRPGVLAALALLDPRSAVAEEWPALARYEAMAIPPDNPMSRPKVDLGRQLFFDPRMSGDGTTACVSCHRPDHGLTDDRRPSLGAFRIVSDRACPTPWNVGYQQALLWEGAAPSVERAINGIWRFLLAPGKEGQAGTTEVVARLNGVAGYRSQFVLAFGEEATVENVPKALAAFLRTLVASRSAWARFQDGEKDALSPQARR